MKKFLVIGNPIEHTLSPKLHNYWIKNNKLDAIYGKIKTYEKDLPELCKNIKDGNLNGINVTVPFKKTIIPFIDILSGHALRTQSVNTISCRDGNLIGDNTDIDGTLNTSGVVTSQTSANISQVALTDGTVSWDAAAAANAFLLLEENSTISAPSNAVEGAIISIEVAQHASSGPYTLAWNAIFEFVGDETPTQTATDAKTDIYAFRYTGSKWQNIGISQNLTQS